MGRGGIIAVSPRYPSLFQINTRVWLQRLSRDAAFGRHRRRDAGRLRRTGLRLGLAAERLADRPAGRSVSRGNPRWRAEFKTALPDLHDEDICGFSFAISAYTISDLLGGERALAQFRERLARRGINLMLDFVPNHTAPDHPWVETRPEYYVDVSEEEALARAPKKLPAGRHRSGIENTSPWPRSQFSGLVRHLQLNYANPELQAARIDELVAIGGKCDEVRRDMAMLLLPEAFQLTWGITPEPFWPKATAAVRAKSSDFTLMAESIGTSNGHCSRASTTAKISGSTTA